MTGFLVLAALVITVVTLLELSNRRHATSFGDPRRTDRTLADRDAGRAKFDLLALAGRAEPLAHKPFSAHRDSPRHSSALPAAG